MQISRQYRSAAALLAACALAAAPLAQAQPAGPAPGETLSQSYRGSQRNNLEYQKVPPIKVFDNLFYVGPGYVSVWLIPTSAGLILVDTSEEPYVDHIVDSIRKVGFKPEDIKYILITHSHLDHFGGAVRLKALTGARIGAVAADWEMIEATGKRPGRNGGPSPAVPARDMVIKDGDTLTLGNTTLKFYETPGHTVGVLSAEFTVFDNGKPHKAFLWGGPGERQGLAGAEQALASANRVAQIPGVEAGVMIHSWLAPTYSYPNGNLFERARARKPGDPNPFIDPASWTQFVKLVQANTTKAVEAEKQKLAAASAGAPAAAPAAAR